MSDTGNARRRSTSLWAQHEWSIVALAAAMAFLLGCWGYALAMSPSAAGSEHTWWDVVYASFQLFIFEGPDATAGWPLQLQIARALAPVVLLYTAAAAILKRTETQIALYKLLFRKRRFVVVCGIGETGFRIAKQYLRHSDKQVVVIERDPMNPMAAELAKWGAIVIFGNAMDPVTLDRARVVYAKEVFLCTHDDQANIAAAKAIDRLTRVLSDSDMAAMAKTVQRHEPHLAGEPPYVGLRAFLCVDEPHLYDVFANHPFFAHATDRFAIRIFNRKQTIARNVFSRCAPDMYYMPREESQPPMHVLFVGFDNLVGELILQTALTAHYPDRRRAQISVLCGDVNRERVQRFLYRFPHLESVVSLKTSFHDPLTLSQAQWVDLQREAPFSVAYVAMREDVDGILAARRLNRHRRQLGEAPVNMVVCLNQQTFLAEIIDDDFLPIIDDKSSLPAHEPIEYFETLDETITIDVVVNDALDTLARTLHNAYLDTLAQTEPAQTAAENASIVPWSALPAHKKQANQHAAAHIATKLRSHGCIACDESDERPAIAFPPDESAMEVLAQVEHRRWMADKQLAGYDYGDTRDEDFMTHPDLVPWEKLGESDKEKDRSNIRQIAGLLAMQGKKVCASG